MKKLVTLFLTLALCASVLAASLQVVGYASGPDSDPTATVEPIDADGLHTVPPGQEGERKD